MQYSQVHIEAIGYELPPVVVSTAELEARLQPVYEALHLQPGQLELLTGINERRWWEPGYPLSEGAAAAARKALAAAELEPDQIDVLIYAGVCREQLEPATACAVAARLGIGGHALIYDISNACLGVLNGLLDIANRIELGQARAGLVVSAETAREINENVIDQIIRTRSLELFRASIATLTGG
ncbi:MAG: 3-oxoacyl-ACP synthase III, partial [Gemmataceae bacterium]|nr:3-oxoacyl-ACP synthase III [Gemmataceae bacterium]